MGYSAITRNTPATAEFILWWRRIMTLRAEREKVDNKKKK
jgi:hypothetical protein